MGCFSILAHALGYAGPRLSERNIANSLFNPGEFAIGNCRSRAQATPDRDVAIGERSNRALTPY